jgi:hypothetical protein
MQARMLVVESNYHLIVDAIRISCASKRQGRFFSFPGSTGKVSGNKNRTTPNFVSTFKLPLCCSFAL